jgi:hypothetical protein
MPPFEHYTRVVPIPSEEHLELVLDRICQFIPTFIEHISMPSWGE